MSQPSLFQFVSVLFYTQVLLFLFFCRRNCFTENLLTNKMQIHCS